jgi:uncharacterized cupin superfamily protein
VTIRVEKFIREPAGTFRIRAVAELVRHTLHQDQRIVSRSYSSPPGFWYDQDEDEWVIVVRGEATLQLEEGELVRMKEGDHVTIPRHTKHRVQQTVRKQFGSPCVFGARSGEGVVVAEESSECFEILSMNGKSTMILTPLPFVLSPVEGLRKEGHGIEPRLGHIFHQSASVVELKFIE